MNLGIKNRGHKKFRMIIISCKEVCMVMKKELNKKLFMYQKKSKKQSLKHLEDIQ